ncbi:helix-turn-helix transcriptional regulator [Streptomyces hokutonensis]|uniref:helix-turn-helix transcriptional regulator n=1 Tax=Streptomyces hokutonensis TaxID=1306990 RepID=UPI000378EE3E|nr:helix-turn-helix transcriptional regulator [Streptomyces hokutonensis]
MASEQSSDGGAELGRFLRARRTRTAPEQVGLKAGTGLRRTPGLRREELATLAGISIDYYVRLERGKEIHPGPTVVDALARALLLDASEHRHLRELASRAAYAPVAPPAPGHTVRPQLRVLLESVRPNAAYVVSRTLDLLASNPGALRLFAGLGDWPPPLRNFARYAFLHPLARDVLDDWDEQARACVGRLRALAGTEPDAPDLADLVGELLAKSPDFADLWNRFDVKPHAPDPKTFHHPEVGDLHLGYESMPMEHSHKQRFVVFFAEPGTSDHDKLIQLDAERGELGLDVEEGRLSRRRAAD